MKPDDIIEKGKKIGTYRVNNEKRDFYEMQGNYASCLKNGDDMKMSSKEEVEKLSVMNEQTFSSILDTVSNEILTDDIKEKMTTRFNEAVQNAVDEKVDDFIAEKEKELTEKHQKLLESYKEEYSQEIDQRIENYLNEIAEDFMKENKQAIDDTISKAKLDALLEGFDALLVTAGVDFAKIEEGVDAESENGRISKLENKLNQVIDENIQIKNENTELLKIGLMNEFMSDMTMVQQQKFETLVETISFDIDNQDVFVESLEKFKSTITGSTEQPKRVDESTKKDENTPSWKRFT